MLLVERRIAILPLYALKCLFIACALLLGGLVITDRYFIAEKEKSGEIETQEWFQENKTLNENNLLKNNSHADNPVWRSAGFPVNPEKPPGKKRILVMGDSYVWGDGSANMNDIWWRSLGREMALRGYNDLEVIAAGYCGLSTHEQLDFAKKIIPQYRPDLVLWGYVSNDPDEKIVPQITMPPESPIFTSVVGLIEKLAPKVHFLLTSRRSSKRTKLLSGPVYGYEYSQWQEKLFDSPNIEKYQETLHELRQVMQDFGLPTFFVSLPTIPYTGHASWFNRVKPYYEKAGIRFHDMLDDYIAAYGKAAIDASVLTYSINPSNGHPGTIPNAYQGKNVADLLEKDYAAYLGPKSAPPTSFPIKINDWIPYDLKIQSADETHMTFVYPETDKLMLRMPWKIPYVELGLENPVHIKGISVSGPNLKASIVYYTALHPGHFFDDHKVKMLERKSGKEASWEIKDGDVTPRVNTIRLSAEFDGPDHTVTIRYIKDPTGNIQQR